MVAILAFAAFSLFDQRNARARLIKERLANERKAPELAAEEELALLRDEQLSRIPALDTLLRRSARVSELQKMLAQAGSRYARRELSRFFCARRGGRTRSVLRVRQQSQKSRGSHFWSDSYFHIRTSPSGATSALKSSKSFFPKPSTRWPVPSAPAMRSPLRLK